MAAGSEDTNEVSAPPAVVMIHWTDQIKELLGNQKALEKSTACGPLQELAFWTKRCTKLVDVSEQLQKPEVRHVHNILQLSKSVYVPRFSKLAVELQVRLHPPVADSTPLAPPTDQ